MNYLLRNLSPSAIAILCLLFVASPTLIACDDDDDEASEEETEDNGNDTDDDDEQASAPTAAPSELTANFPADAEVVANAPSISTLIGVPEQTAQSDNISADTQGQWQELFQEFRDEMTAEVGYDLFDADQYGEWGIDVDGELFFGMADAPIFCVPVSDESAFETFAVDVAATEFGEVEDAELETDDLDGHDLYAVDDLFWIYHGDSACMSGEFEGIEPSETLASFLEGPGEGNSLADSDEFQNFVDAGMSSGLFNLYTGGDALMDELTGPMGGPMGMGMMLGEFLGGQGTSLILDDDTLKLRMWSGLEEERSEMVQGIVTPEHSFDWERFATADTSAALRLSLNPERIWEQVEAFLAQEFEAATGEIFAAAMEDSEDANAEDYLIRNLSGHIGLFVYDLPEPMAFMMNEPEELGEDMEVIAAIHFADAEPLEEAFQGFQTLLEADSDDEITFEALDDDITVIDVDDVEARIYHHDTIIAIASTGLSNDDVSALLLGDRVDDSLSRSDAVLGAAMEDENFNGLYLGDDIWGYLGDFLELPDADEHFDEFVLRVDADDKGISVGADFHPAGSAIFGFALAAMSADTMGSDVPVESPPAVELGN